MIALALLAGVVLDLLDERIQRARAVRADFDFYRARAGRKD